MTVDAEAQFHVLAVDDNLIDRRIIQKLLQSSSFMVTAVESGSKALEFLELQDEHRLESPSSIPTEHHVVEVNLIITDYCMPGMTGYDLLKRVKESSSFRDIPVVIMSSENVPSRIDRCLAEGAEDFLLKPVKRFDIGRLKPHILKAKSKDRQQVELLQNQKTSLEEEQREEEMQQAKSKDVQQPKLHQKDPPLPEEEQKEQEQQQNNNKRKATDHEGLVEVSRRPRLNGLTVL